MALNVSLGSAVLLKLLPIALLLLGAAEDEDANQSHIQNRVPQYLRAYVTDELAALFEPGTSAIPNGGGFRELHYRLFEPTDLDSKREYRYPLIVFLNGHGKEQTQDDNLGQLKHLQDLIFHEPEHPELYPFFLLAVHCPLDESGKCLQWSGDRGPEDGAQAAIDVLDATMQVVDELGSQYPIDQRRILILGISSGGTAAWELAIRHPDRFAAVVPTASDGTLDKTRLNRLGKLPIWAFHSSGDHPERVEKTVAELNKLGGNAHLTILERDAHGCWDQAFERYDLLDWMFSQRRGNENASWSKSAGWHAARRDYLSSTGILECLNEAWPRTIPIVAVIGVAILFRREYRKQRLRSGASCSQHGVSST